MSDEYSIIVMYGIPIKAEEATKAENINEAVLADIYTGKCVFQNYGIIGSGYPYIHWFLGIPGTLRWAPNGASDALRLDLETDTEDWDRQLFTACLDLGLASLQAGWKKTPGWYMLPYVK